MSSEVLFLLSDDVLLSERDLSCMVRGVIRSVEEDRKSISCWVFSEILF